MPKRHIKERSIHPQLQVEELPELHETGWKAQRIGWVMMIAVMILGAFGLFGGGLLSQQTPTVGNYHVEYERFFRYEAEMKVQVTSAHNISTLKLPQDYLKNFKLVRSEPEAEKNVSSGNGIVLDFPGGSTHIVSLYVIPKSYGQISGDLTINDSLTLPLNHFIYP